MRQQIGFLFQIAALTLLPMVLLWEWDYGFRPLMMPLLTVVGIVLFYIGHRLRGG